jgi:hypothetical protein
MTYEKPEVTVLGDPATLIQGIKQGGTESGLAVQQFVPDNELND